jgi:hypothetical protein
LPRQEPLYAGCPAASDFGELLEGCHSFARSEQRGALRQIPDKSHGDNLGRVDDNVFEEEKKFYEDNSPAVESVEKMNIQGLPTSNIQHPRQSAQIERSGSCV